MTFNENKDLEKQLLDLEVLEMTPMQALSWILEQQKNLRKKK